MITRFFNWKSALSLIAITIISATIFYSDYLGKKIAEEERLKAEFWVEAQKLLVQDTTGLSDKLVFTILLNNKSIPIIQTDEKGNILDYVNLDTLKIARNPGYIQEKLKDFKKHTEPIIWVNPSDSSQRNIFYYGNSSLLMQVRYYPIVQLFIVSLFIIVTVIALTTSFNSEKNQVWAGMAKETAHQLGTPISSLQGWVEVLKESGGNEEILQEMNKDINRLNLISDRFGKIGSTPNLEKHELVSQVENMVEYIRKRSPEKVKFTVNAPSGPIYALLSPPLFDWVMENLLKNALDAIEGKGEIRIDIREKAGKIKIDVTDSGKGISRKNVHKIFNPGFTTKKRGWGLGLSLSKRIIEQFHKGQLFVKTSEPGHTVFRVVLNSPEHTEVG